MPLTSPRHASAAGCCCRSRLILTVLTSALVVVMYIGALFNPLARRAV